MKIACFQNLPASGARRALYHFAKGLKEKGHSLDYYTFKKNSGGLFSPELVADNTYICDKEFKMTCKTIKPYFLKLIYVYFLREKYYQEMNLCYKKMAEDIDQRGYDLVFSHNCQFTQAPFLLRHLKTPTIYYAHEPLRAFYDSTVKNYYDPIIYEGKNVFKKFKTLLENKLLDLQAQLFKNADATNIHAAHSVLTNSQFTKKAIFNAYGISAEVCQPGVDIHFFSPKNEVRENYVLSVGGLAKSKMHHFVVEALSKINKDIQPRLVVIGQWGDPEYPGYLLNLAKELDVPLELKRDITDQELLTIYHKTKIFVFVPVMEPLGLVTLEAMACKTPVVAIKEGGLLETVKDGKTGILVNRDVDQCARAIERVLRDESLAQSMGENARKEVEASWSWEKCCDRLENTFLKFLNK